MGLFDKTPKPAALAAVHALAGKTGLTTESAKAANEELAAAGIADAALITQSEYQALAAKASRVEAAEKTAADLKASNDQLTTANTKLTTDLAASEKEVTRLGALGGAEPTTAGKKEGDQQESSKAHAWFDPKAEHNAEAAALLG